jgi:hypothetical protein
MVFLPVELGDEAVEFCELDIELEDLGDPTIFVEVGGTGRGGSAGCA